MIVFFAHFSALLFALSTLCYLGHFIFHKRILWNSAQGLLLLGLSLQALGFGLHFVQVGLPFLLRAEEAFLFSGWVLAALFLILQLRYDFQWGGLIVMPAVLVLYALAHFAPEEFVRLHPHFNSLWVSIHIVFSFLAFSLFVLTFLMGILFLVEHYQLKHKKICSFTVKLPPLETLEQLHFRALRLGFILLSLGIVSGLFWAKDVRGQYFSKDPRQILTFIAWFLYAFFFHVRFAAGWKGRKGVLLSLLGFLVILFTFLEVRHV